MKKLNVFYITDNHFAHLVGISITSMFINNPVDRISLTVYILTTDMDEENRKKFQKLSEEYRQTIVIIDVGNELARLEQLNLSKYRGSAMTNLRLCFDKYIPQQVERILYLDADTIISGSILELSEYDMKGKMLGMVYDAYGHTIADKEHTENAYYNAGVILIDCEKWRRGMWRKKIIHYIKRNGAWFAHPDQDIFNIICGKEIIPIPIRYNLQPVHVMYSDKVVCKYTEKYDYYSIDEIANGRSNPAILHMIRVFGRNPWHKRNGHPYKAQYMQYKGESLWGKCKEEIERIGLVIGIEKIIHKIFPEELFYPLALWAIKISMK